LYLYRLINLDFSRKKSFLAILYLLFSPWAFFFVAVYTESVFLLLTVLSFYFAKKNKWLSASISGGLAVICRLSGVFLFVALLAQYIISEKKQNKKNYKNIFWLALMPLSLLGFMSYLKARTGSFFSFLSNQTAYNRKFTMPWQTIWNELRVFWAYIKTEQIIEATIIFWVFLALAISIYLLIKKRKEIGASYSIYCWLSILIPLFSGTTTSMGRYLLVLFPIFIAAALVENKRFKLIWLSLGLLTLVYFSFLFVGWYFVG